MEKEIVKMVKMICEKYGKRETVVKIMLVKSQELGYNKKDSSKIIEEFYKK